MPHPCLSCGACCTQYRVAFHWMESDEATEGGVPAAMTERLDATADGRGSRLEIIEL